MLNEVSQKENWPGLPPGDHSPPEVEESGQSTVSGARVAEREDLVSQAEAEKLGEGAVSEIRVVELERLLGQRNEELAKANTRLIELEQGLASKGSEVATLKQAEADLEEKLTTLRNSLAEAVTSYKAMVVQTNPEVVKELISGDTIESINESLSKAKTLVSKVRRGVEAEILLARVPAGAPERTSPDLSALSPREKIKYAIGGFSH